jgi:hypothetical protein
MRLEGGLVLVVFAVLLDFVAVLVSGGPQNH